MSKVRVPVEGLAGEQLTLAKEAAHYVTRVRRLDVGDTCVLFDPALGLEAEATIVEAHRGRVVVSLEALGPSQRIPERRVTLLQGVGKGDKIGDIVRDATELGATRIIPLSTERSVPTRDRDHHAKRWRKIALDAARQCGRGDVPEVFAPHSISEAISRVFPEAGATGCVLTPDAERLIGNGDLPFAEELFLAVGPEGGFTREEVRAFEAAGLEARRLRGFILRTETVCAAVLGALLLRSEP